LQKKKKKIDKLVILGYTRFFFVSKIILDSDFTKSILGRVFGRHIKKLETVVALTYITYFYRKYSTKLDKHLVEFKSN